ncbi:nitrogen fixation protein NifM [Methylicorpusculum sp.]|uniref:nitrogen fixation protein NifM n=1 Tax=Methylicorpusculum sp. TaxID=2713644 RepID=UPI00273124EE|nr:nitrogen fixation protein NifM [Methylicorpusculum sp.]MDP2179060.1 nitrogen fixation protein NifM [Methylicorpusculum sp.]MDP3529430.1 nitrogen fixation protein NifM [Methylicorpusculum sp.]MDZ4153692.1 nitrogen fixation protein NifM [Methylicorpusculum sp.]
MTMTAEVSIEPYTLLRAALALFKKPPTELESEQFTKARIHASKAYEIETRVLNSKEATCVIISDEELDRAYGEIRSRFDDDESFLETLKLNNLNSDGLRAALKRECKVNSVMDKVASRSPSVSEVEIGIFYHCHPEKFNVPEQRTVRHILITINPDYPENSRENARQRLLDIRLKLKNKPYKFPDLALKFSECPTSLQGGMLGVFASGILYPEIDAVLFNLKLNEISQIIETEVGFHIIECIEIVKAETLSLQKATPKIREIMQERYRRNCQKAWLSGLPK